MQSASLSDQSVSSGQNRGIEMQVAKIEADISLIGINGYVPRNQCYILKSIGMAQISAFLAQISPLDTFIYM